VEVTPLCSVTLRVYLAGTVAPDDDWRFQVVPDILDHLDDSGACPLHRPPSPSSTLLHLFLPGVATYAGPWFRLCRHHHLLPEPLSSILPSVFSSTVVFAYLDGPLTISTAIALTVATCYQKNFWLASPMSFPLQDWQPDDFLLSSSPVAALRTFLNRHYQAYCHTLPYDEYLHSALWQRVRQEALTRAGHCCQLCNLPHHLQVHHRTYERRGFELPADLIVLCSACHARHHQVRVAATCGPDLRTWKLANVTRYFQASPDQRRQRSTESDYLFDAREYLELASALSSC
jgi:hypothetical protein